MAKGPFCNDKEDPVFIKDEDLGQMMCSNCQRHLKRENIFYLEVYDEKLGKIIGKDIHGCDCPHWGNENEKVLNIRIFN